MSLPPPARYRSVLRLEPLESREVPATLVSPTTVTYQDVDGDNVTVLLSQPKLTAANVNTLFTFDVSSVNGSNTTKQQLRTIDLSSLGVAATGMAVTTTAVRSTVNGGDGFAALGQINATGIDLGAVKVDGDLGRILAGDATTTTTGLASLKVHSMGRFGTSTGATNLTTIQGRLGSLTVRTDVKDAFIQVLGGVDGKIGSIAITGSLIGGAGGASGLIVSDGAITSLKIGGDVIGGAGGNSGRISSDGAITSLTIGGDVIGGAGNSSGCIFSFGAITSLAIGGSVIGGAGGNSGLIFSNGAITNLAIGGNLIGGAGDPSGLIFSNGAITSLKIGGDLIGGSAAGTDNLRNSGSIEAQRIGTLTIGGSLTAGTDTTSGTFSTNGAIRVSDDIGSVTIGNIVGNATNPAIISARGRAVPTTTDLAIGKLTVKGRVEFAQILAGYDTTGAPVNADAQIGPVIVVGDWIASSLVAGAIATNGLFGDADDAAIAGGNPTIASKITSLTIGGQALGTVGGADHFGIVAQSIGIVKIGGTTMPTAVGFGNDDFFVGITSDFKINEI